MKRRGFFKGMLAGGVAGGSVLATRALAPTLPTVVEKIVEKPVIHEVIVTRPPERLTSAEIQAFIAGPYDERQVLELTNTEPKIVHLDQSQDVMWNGIGFHIPAGDPLLPGPIAYVLVQSREDALLSQVELFGHWLKNGERA